MDTQRKIQAFLSYALQKGVFQRENDEWVAFGQAQLVELLNIIYPLWTDYLNELDPPKDNYDLVLDYSFRTKRMTAKCSVHGPLPVIKHADDRMQYDITVLDAWLHQRNHHGYIGLPEFDVLSDPDRWHDVIAYAMGESLGSVTTVQLDFR